jgi:hypothetical protein
MLPTILSVVSLLALVVALVLGGLFLLDRAIGREPH